MYLEKLRLFNFKNYNESLFEFSEKLNCIVGKNGSGKTNLLDAIYFLSLTKSFIHNKDLLSITFDEEFSLIEGAFINEDKGFIISCSLQTKGGKTLLADQKPYDRLSDHIGKIPLVLITPNDTDLIRDGSETRRKLFDGIMAQISPQFLQQYLLYNKILNQRNRLLKQFVEQNYYNADLLKIYSDQLIDPANYIHTERKRFIDSFLPFFKENYNTISQKNEDAGLEYKSRLNEIDFGTLIEQNLETDRHAQRTTEGVHKDDFDFLMDGKPIKQFGSQGQRKSYVLALKLAQFFIIKKGSGLKPLLLLDDIFDKLDEPRINRLITLISKNQFGQVFITDAQPHRTKDLLKDFNAHFIYTSKED